MPRPRRYELVDIPQHVVQRGNNRQRTFFDESDFRFYLECLDEASRRHGCEVHAYVLMPNHVHVLATPKQPGAIGRVIQSVGRRYVRRINDRLGRTGTLWDGRHHASLVATGSYLFNCYRYIELNPVRAGMVTDPAHYRWSSHRRNAFGECDELVTDHDEYTALAGETSVRLATYRELFEAEVDEAALANIRRSLKECRAYGSDDFKERMEAVLKRPIRPVRTGRPRKSPGLTPIRSETPV